MVFKSQPRKIKIWKAHTETTAKTKDDWERELKFSINMKEVLLERHWQTVSQRS